MNAGQNTRVLGPVGFPALRLGSLGSWLLNLLRRNAHSVPSSFEAAASLVHAPERWRQMNEDELEGQLTLVLAGFGRGQSGLSATDITRFLDHAFEHLSVERRVRLVAKLSESS
jgi:hypothetical protein